VEPKREPRLRFKRSEPPVRRGGRLLAEADAFPRVGDELGQSRRFGPPFQTSEVPRKELDQPAAHRAVARDGVRKAARDEEGRGRFKLHHQIPYVCLGAPRRADKQFGLWMMMPIEMKTPILHALEAERVSGGRVDRLE
jgi:hypothetical protein